MLKILFFFSFLIVFYSYIGYGILIYLFVKIKRIFFSKNVSQPDLEFEPEVTLVVAAFNEEAFIERKIKNSLDLDYPPGKLKWVFITDGSTDETPEIISRYKNILLLHQPERRGKVAAMNRAIKYVETPYTIFCDANTLLNRTCIREIVKHYSNPRVGGVAGRRKLFPERKTRQLVAGEGNIGFMNQCLRNWIVNFTRS